MPTPEELGAIANATDYRLQSTIDLHQQRLQKSLLLLENKIMQGVNDLQTTSAGVLLGPKVNLKQAQKVHTKLATIFDETYGEGVRQVVAGYDEAAHFAVNSFSELDEAAKFTSFDQTMVDTLKHQDFQQFMAYGVQAQEQIAQAMYAHVAGGATMAQLRGVIAGHLLGSVDARGRSMATYATQFANDAVMNFHNAVVLQKGKDAGLDHFLYYGNIMRTSRDFCIRRVMQVFSREEIEGWDFQWAGKSGPAMTHRGGYNCRHHWQPVLQEWIPEGELPAHAYPNILERYAMSPEEAYLKKQLNQLRYNIKTGKKITMDTPLVADLWYHMHPQERKNLLGKWWNDKIFDNNPAAYNVLDKSHVPGKAPPLDKAPPLKQSGVMLTESPNAKFPKPKVVVEELTEEDIVVTPKLKPVPKPTPIPKKQPTPTPVATTGSTGGKAWNDLTAAEKKVFGNYGYKMKQGKFKYHPTFATVWESLSAEAQAAKIASWKKLGYVVPDDLPVKNLGAAVKVLDDTPIAPPVQKPPKPEVVNVGSTPIDADKPNWTFETPTLAEKQFEATYGFKVTAAGFDATGGVSITNSSGNHLQSLLENHPKLKKIKLQHAKSNLSPRIVFYNKGALNASGTLGVYNDGTGLLKVAAASNRTFVHQLNLGKNGWSVGGDYYSTLRHEYGHHVDNILRKTTNHQDEWRKIYKSYTKSEWKMLFGEYSSVDKYEGFAEAFSAYTSPLYKKGDMPAKIENYLKKVLGDTRVFVEEVKDTAKPVAAAFKSIKHQKMYDEYYNKFIQKDITPDAAKAYFQRHCNGVISILNKWQSSTQGGEPSLLKYKIVQLLKRKDLKFVASSGSSIDVARLKAAVDRIPDEEVIQMYAMTQAYYDKTGTKAVKLFRGTNGRNTGPKMRKKVNELKAKVPEEDWDKTVIEVEEAPLNGWTTPEAAERVAKDDFGVNTGGITTGTDIPKEDIFVPHELWPKRAEYDYEEEYIVIRSGKQQYKLTDIESGYKKEVAKAASTAAKTQTTSSSVYMLDDQEYYKSVDIWFHSKGTEWQGWTKQKAILKLEQKIAGVKDAVAHNKPIKLGYVDISGAGPAYEGVAANVVAAPSSADDVISMFETILDKVKEYPADEWDDTALMNWIAADPWEEV